MNIIKTFILCYYTFANFDRSVCRKKKKKKKKRKRISDDRTDRKNVV